MSDVILQEITQHLLEDPLLGDQDIDTKVRSLLESEYLRRSSDTAVRIDSWPKSTG